MVMTREEASMRERILLRLVQEEPGRWLSGEKLSGQLGISRAAVSKHISSLREEGNIIESVPRRGYRLISRADPWAGSDAGEGLQTKVLGQSAWIWLKETDSTNQVAVLEALNGAREGLVVVARRPGEGRGSRGHRWVNLPGSLCFSVLTRPDLPPERAGELPQLVMEAVARAVRRIGGPELERKAPNDLLLNGRKVTGILVESMFHNAELQWAVAGMGVNVNVPAEALPPELEGIASSLYAETGTPFSVTALLRCILEELENILSSVRPLQSEKKGSIL